MVHRGMVASKAKWHRDIYDSHGLRVIHGSNPVLGIETARSTVLS